MPWLRAPAKGLGLRLTPPLLMFRSLPPTPLHPEEPYTLRVPRSQRGGEVIEPLVSEQWFVKMDGMAAQALQKLEDGELRILPQRFEKVYTNWLSGIQARRRRRPRAHTLRRLWGGVSPSCAQLPLTLPPHPLRRRTGA